MIVKEISHDEYHNEGLDKVICKQNYLLNGGDLWFIKLSANKYKGYITYIRNGYMLFKFYKVESDTELDFTDDKDDNPIRQTFQDIINALV